MKSICVYCSSSDHIDPAFRAPAKRLGQLIAEHGDRLVYGGGSVGLMGDCARAVHEHGGKVVGVIPESLTQAEVAYHNADELIVTQTMRERKQIMDDKADAFVVLPGGFGTLEELAEILVLKILNYTDRPLIVVNPDGFYDPLVTLFQHFVDHGFAKPKHLAMVTFVNDVDAVYGAIGGGD
ncbi:MAG: TIGR00730 family Rossman fold protein [Phycisphaerales bacterium JB063]